MQEFIKDLPIKINLGTALSVIAIVAGLAFSTSQTNAQINTAIANFEKQELRIEQLDSRMDKTDIGLVRIETKLENIEQLIRGRND